MDRKCPVCKKQTLMIKWSKKEKYYDVWCSSLKCDYDNILFKDELP